MPAPVKTFGDSEKAAEDCHKVEEKLHALHAAYDMYFLGQERKPPTKLHDEVKKGLLALKNQIHRQTAVKFRIGSLSQKLATYERLWERTLKEMEAGTYARDIFKARLHRQAKEKQHKENKDKKPAEPEFHIDEDMMDDDDAGERTDPELSPNVMAALKAAQKPPPPPAAALAQQPPPPPRPATGQAPALQRPATGTAAAFKPPNASPAAPGAPARPPAPVGASGGLTDQKIKAIYDAYVTAKKRCGEDTSALSLNSVADSLKKQVPALMKQHNAKSVEFKVVIKDGKAVLRALPKE